MSRQNRPNKEKTFSEPIFLEMSNYSSPVVSEVQGKQWISYGSDNNYFSYLLDRYRGSPTNNAIINGMADAIIGEGITVKGKQTDVMAYTKLKSLFRDDELRKWAFDLKCYGFYVQVIIRSEDLSTIAAIDYTPVQNWRSGKANEDGEVLQMFYSDDWTRITKAQYKPVAYSVYNTNIKVAESVLVVKPYRSGSFYYPSVDYQGALQYAHIEEEVANYHLNNIMNGLAPGMLINFNNGDPGQEQRNLIEQRIKAKWGGSSNAGKFILSFNDNKDVAATIEAVQIPELDKQYQFISEEATKKIMVGHRVTSPLFFGIRDSSGLGSNADEIKNAWLLYERTVLRPYRILMLSNIDFVLSQIGINLDIDFVSLTPIEFKKEPTKQEQLCNHKTGAELLIDLGEEIDLDKWELIDEGEVDYELELASMGTAKPNAKSDQDRKIDDINYKVRYEYGGSETPQREFCQKMMAAKKLYRKEDIMAMESQAVNPGWGVNGADTYSIWLYKGGGDCHHKWIRKTFVSKTGIDVNSPNAPTISTNKAQKEGYRIDNPTEVSMMPKDMPKHGFVNKYK